jgi:hypothetical protein
MVVFVSSILLASRASAITGLSRRRTCAPGTAFLA